MANKLRGYTPEDIRSSWKDQYEWDRDKIINDERQIYVAKNDKNSRIVQDSVGSVLEMMAQKEAVKGNFTHTNGNKVNEQPYSSSVFISQGREYVNTGEYVEFECKLPAEEGCFPAGWLLRADPVWQKSEIDIFEGVGHVNSGEYHVAFHSHTESKATYQKLGSGIKSGANITSEFNLYGAHITENEVDYYFNRKKVASTTLHDHEKNLKWYMLLNLAIASSGSWAAGGATEPYNWNTATLCCRGITVFDGVPAVGDIAASKPAESTPIVQSSTVNATSSDVNDGQDYVSSDLIEPIRKALEEASEAIIKAFVEASVEASMDAIEKIEAKRKNRRK